MNTFYTVVMVVQVLAALAVIGLVLLQHGKGADMGATFGAGASGSLFGAAGSSNFLSKSTAIAAALFFATTLALAFRAGRENTANSGANSVMERLPAKPASTPASSASASTSLPPAVAPNPNEVPK